MFEFGASAGTIEGAVYFLFSRSQFASSFHWLKLPIDVWHGACVSTSIMSSGPYHACLAFLLTGRGTTAGIRTLTSMTLAFRLLTCIEDCRRALLGLILP